MKLPHLKTVLAGATLVVTTIALVPAAMAGHNHGRMYQVTFQDATLGQPLSPPVVATHTKAFQLFELGLTPGPLDDGYDQYFGLAAVAETGYPDLLLDAVSVADGVWEAKAYAGGVTGPGMSGSLMISASGDAKYLSVASMLGMTNDGFWALRGVALPRGIGDTARYFANGYDAGSEANAESAGTVGDADGDDPGAIPPVGIDDGSGEGFISVHAGIHGVGGIGGLDPAIYDWRDPVVEVTIERIQ